jgi:hypothetical protein
MRGNGHHKKNNRIEVSQAHGTKEMHPYGQNLPFVKKYECIFKRFEEFLIDTRVD